MPTKEKQLTNADRMMLKTVLDRVIPPVDDLPGAGAMGLAAQVENIAGRVPRLHGSLIKMVGALSLDLHSHAKGGFNSLTTDQQDEALRTIESALPGEFGNFLELVFLAYYSDSRVHKRIGWHGRPPQPEGYEMEPFDEAILETARKREPFWRKDK
ncbi:MAG: hypothetical protein EXR57_01200 [Dehalococcoidia bacterium]|nr:hypothetical protein [Dehalococcoidia bacterium]